MVLGFAAVNRQKSPEIWTIPVHVPMWTIDCRVFHRINYFYFFFFCPGQKIADRCKFGWCPGTVQGIRREERSISWRNWKNSKRWSRPTRPCVRRTWPLYETGKWTCPKTIITSYRDRGSRNSNLWPCGSRDSSRRYWTRRTTAPNSEYVHVYLISLSKHPIILSFRALIEGNE